MHTKAYRHRLSSQNDKALRSHHQKPRELMGQDSLNFISLLDLNRDADGVDGRFNQDLFVFVARDNDRV